MIRAALTGAAQGLGHRRVARELGVRVLDAGCWGFPGHPSPGSVVVGVPGQVISRSHSRAHIALARTDDVQLPDVLGIILQSLLTRRRQAGGKGGRPGGWPHDPA